MKRALLFLALTLTLTSWASADSDWVSRILHQQRQNEEIREFFPDGSKSYRFRIDYPYWLAVPAFTNVFKTRGLSAELARFDYAVISTRWADWIQATPETSPPDWLLGVRSRTHLILLREPEATTAIIREEVQQKTKSAPEWTSIESSRRDFDRWIEASVARSVLGMRYSSNWADSNAIIDAFEADQELGTEEGYQLPEAHPLPTPSPEDVRRELRTIEPDKEIGYLKRLYWTGQINEEEYELLENLVVGQ